MDIWVPEYFVPVAKAALPSKSADRYVVRGFEEMKTEYDNSKPVVAFHNNFHTTLRTHLVTRQFNIMNDADVGLQHKNYPKLKVEGIDISEFNLPDRYVVLTPGYTAPVRKLPAKVWEQIADWTSKNKCPAVWLGAKSDTVTGSSKPETSFDEIRAIDFDLRDKTTLLQAAAIIDKARAIVGVDNGLIHLAGCTNTKIVAGYTSVDPMTRLPIRNSKLGDGVFVVEPSKYLDCRYVQSQSHFNYQADFRQCLCGTNACVESLTAEKFIEQLENALRS
jgi:ADP-heptose:LPS heptosyltransferase